MISSCLFNVIAALVFVSLHLYPSAGYEDITALKWLFQIHIFFLSWRTIVLQYCVGFCHTTAWISHKDTYVPFLLSLPPTPWPSRLSQGPALSPLCDMTASHWLSVLYMVMYICQCCSLSSSRLLLPLLCPKSVLYVCISTPALQIGSKVPFF